MNSAIPKIVVITDGYPNPVNRTEYSFVKELVDQWRLLGVKVVVIRPMTIKDYIRSYHKNQEMDTFFPLYIRFRWMRALKSLRPIQTKISDCCYQKAIERTIKDFNNLILYSHFLVSGIIAARIGEKHNLKTFCAFGDSSLWFLRDRKEREVSQDLSKIDGYISVSSLNSIVLKNHGWANEKKILTIPNCVDLNKFQNLSQNESRKELNIHYEGIIGIFVGHFNDRKGSLRVDKATRDIKELKMIYIGSGEEVPNGKNTLFVGKVDHDELNKYLSAADFFVLPTKAEGCCNAIVEALAAGLPIISSDGQFNDDILDECNSIRVPAEDVKALHDAIEILVNDRNKLLQMKKYVRSQRMKYSIENRAKSILEFMTR